MFIKSLELSNFRNYQTLRVSFDENKNIFYGDNAQGKTNILEAAYLCGTTKSHRGSKDREMIRFSDEEAHIRMIICKEGVSHRIDMHLKKNRPKGIAIDGIPIRKASSLFGIVNFVFFSPEDLSIVKNGPQERRRFLDSEYSQLSKLYMLQLANYNKVLLQRNKLLKTLGDSNTLLSTLDVWDEQLLGFGTDLIRGRSAFIEQLDGLIRGIHRRLTGGKEEIELIYEPSASAEEFRERLAEGRSRDIRFRSSNIGPHRDDLCIKVNGIDLRKYGSQGQQRTAALSLKLSEIDLVKKVIHDTPVLLLDDVLSELDRSRQNYLLSGIGDIQTLITCTGLDDFVNSRFHVNRVFEVSQGAACVANPPEGLGRV